ncbi:MAG TPA: glycosyltransferase family 39 protein, partial [Tepidisphaeraceae bacterium]|nr:glycosyltransferase family 39 protein [Tepidisphaeraceae bacterium]
MRPSARSFRLPLGVLACIHVGLLAYAGQQDSPTWDETGHFAAGVSHWYNGDFTLYRVNPPLARLVATAPVVALHRSLPFRRYSTNPGPFEREEFPGGEFMARVIGPGYFHLLTIARWACIPFGVLGLLICFFWARDLYGPAAGLCAASLWTFSPNVLAHGHLITPDVCAASFGALAGYLFWRWLRFTSWRRSVAAGLAFGFALLGKSTWIILFGLWPVVWLIYVSRPPTVCRAQWWRTGAQLGAIMIIALATLNAGYGFEHTGKRLGDYAFGSRLFGGDPAAGQQRAGNRFSHALLRSFPVPLPANFLQGIDSQRQDFESNMLSYLNGEWRNGGWWYYYLYAMLIKVPLGTWGLFVFAVGATIMCRRYSAPLKDEAVLLLSAVAVLVLVSSQTGINHHLRYVLPAFPFLFIWISKIAQSVDFGHMKLAAVAGAALAWSIGSSLWVYPHSLSYFNELVGGPMGGHYHLGNSNADWGQDLFNLRRWLDKHPEAAPLHFACDMPLIDPKMAGIESLPVPIGPHSSRAADLSPNKLGPFPGWYAISVNKLHDLDRNFDYFLDLKPVGRAGYSIYIYDVTTAQVNALRKKLGLPALE